MAQLPKVFDQEVAPSSYDPLPAGWYMVRIADAEIKQTKAGNGSYVSIRYDVLGPTHQGRVVYGNITISNQSRKAEEIGEQQMAALRSSIGLARITDTDQLIGATVEIKLKVNFYYENGMPANLSEKEKEAYKVFKNDVSAYRAIEGGRPPMPAAPKKEQAPPSFDSLPPWGK
jgi:hypothetical protein